MNILIKVNSTNHQGNSILFAALEKKSIRIIELLLKNSANPNFMCKQSGKISLIKEILLCIKRFSFHPVQLTRRKI